MQAAFDRELSRLLDGYGGPLLLAVSGGVDSMTLLHLVRHSSLGLPFAVAHVNFSLRPGDCDRDEALVRDTCEASGIPFFTKKFDTAAYASVRGISIEMAARELRYGWFSELMDAHGYGRLLVAHNQNDSAETMLLNLLRGTGLKGLCGIREASGAVLRPMLGFSRKQIEAFAAEQGIAFREDVTNSDVEISRNRLRHNVFPEFEKINPSFLNTFREEAGRFAQAQAVLDELLEAKRATLCSRNGDAEGISIAALESEPHREYWLYRLLEQYGFTAAQTASALETIGGQSGKEFLSATHRLIRDREYFKIYPLEIGSEYKLEVDTFPRPAGFDPKGAPAGVLYADADTLPQRLQCRPWRHGDRFNPLGMKGSRLVSDFFTDLKLDLEQKNRARIVYWEDASGEHIAAVAPWRIADRHKITPTTRRIAAIRLSL
ncbi:MAG: tRNA lysidine(34) synthetase TilS [Bacteroidales bacterium]|nr:tRNA lysidine(34) synthetase TilS [Bacteroidales bacterium]